MTTAYFAGLPHMCQTQRTAVALMMTNEMQVVNRLCHLHQTSQADAELAGAAYAQFSTTAAM